jgi:hypothetical protein
MVRAILGLMLTACAQEALAGEIDPLCERVLSAGEAESIAGVKPLALVGPSQVRFATGTCNYATQRDGERTLVLLVSVSHGAKAKDLEQLRHVAIRPRAVQGIGDEAFAADGVVGFRKGKTIVSLGSFFDQKTGKHRISPSKLVDLAKVFAARIEGGRPSAPPALPPEAPPTLSQGEAPKKEESP